MKYITNFYFNHLKVVILYTKPRVNSCDIQERITTIHSAFKHLTTKHKKGLHCLQVLTSLTFSWLTLPVQCGIDMVGEKRTLTKRQSIYSIYKTTYNC